MIMQNCDRLSQGRNLKFIHKFSHFQKLKLARIFLKPIFLSFHLNAATEVAATISAGRQAVLLSIQIQARQNNYHPSACLSKMRGRCGNRSGSPVILRLPLECHNGARRNCFERESVPQRCYPSDESVLNVPPRNRGVEGSWKNRFTVRSSVSMKSLSANINVPCAEHASEMISAKTNQKNVGLKINTFLLTSVHHL